MRKSYSNKDVFVEYIVCVAITLTLMIVIGKVFSVILISPDDTTYKAIMSGAFTGNPEAHCYFIQYPLAWLIVQLYGIWNNVEWYTLFLIGCHGLCYLTIFTRVRNVSRNYKWKYLVLAVIVISILWVQHLVNIEWTVTSGILGATAIFRYITIPKEGGKYYLCFEYAICIALLLLSFCLRSSVAYMYVPVIGICWIKRIYDAQSKKTKKSEIKINVIFLICSILSISGTIAVHHFAYNGDEWKDYIKYTENRSALVDFYGYPDYDKYSSVYNDIGISKEAYDLVVKDYDYAIAFYDKENLDLTSIAEVAKAMDEDNKSNAISSAVSLIKKTLADPECKVYIISIIILGVVNSIVLCKQNKSDLGFVYISVIWAIAIVFYLALKGRFPVRVAVTIGMGLDAVLFANIFQVVAEFSKNNMYRKWNINTGIIYATVCSILIITSGVRLNTVYQKNTSNRILSISTMNIIDYCNKHTENIYFKDFISFTQRGELFLHNSEYVANNYIRTGGWLYNTPVYRKRQEIIGCGDLIQAIRGGNIYYLVKSERSDDVIERLDLFFEAKNENITIEIVDNFNTESDSVDVLHFKINY